MSRFDAYIADIETKLTKRYPEFPNLSSLDRHVLAFGQRTPNNEGKQETTYSTDTIAAPLKAHGEKKPNMSGFFVNAFNGAVSGQCPLGKHHFSTEGQTYFGNNFHLGTFRLYQTDGSFDEAEWLKIATHLAKNGMIVLSDLLASLNSNVKIASSQSGTGRHSDCTRPKAVQITSSEIAWKEVFTILASHWVPSPKDEKLEPAVDTDMLMYFFKDTLVCFELANQLGLPQAKPEEEKTTCGFACC